MNLEGRTALITGAAGGIGRALARSLASRGCDLALADIDEAGLRETQALVLGNGSTSTRDVSISLHRLDVTDATAIAELPAAIAQRHPNLHLLINNAGVAVGGQFEEVSQTDFEWLFTVNFWGTVRMTRAFLPILRQGGEARIVNLSSLFGLIAPPGQTAYCASKFAVRGFSDALSHELQGSKVAVSVVCPGGVATSIARNARRPPGRSPEDMAREVARIEKLLRMHPQQAAEIIVRGVERGKRRILVGADARLGSLLERLLPVSYWRFLALALR